MCSRESNFAVIQYVYYFLIWNNRKIFSHNLTFLLVSKVGKYQTEEFQYENIYQYYFYPEPAHISDFCKIWS